MKKIKTVCAMHAVRVLIFLFLAFPSNIKAKNPEKSDLEQISENFRILSRVTNAIYLSAETIKKDINVTNIYCELLQVSPENLEKVTNVDVEPVTEEINRIIKEFEKIKTKIQNEANISTKLTDLTSTYMKLFENMERWKDDAKEHWNQLREISTNLRSNNLINNDCLSFDIPTFEKFHSLFDKEMMVLPLPPENEVTRIMNDFLGKSENMKSCSEVLSRIKNNDSLLELIRFNESKLLDVELTLAKIRQFALLGKNTNHATDMNLLIQKLSTLLHRTKPIWQGDSNPGSMLLAMHGLNKSITVALDALQNPYLTDDSSTGGLQNLADLSKVFTDIESQWFKKIVAKGASTKKLADAFEPHRKISKEIILLESSWKELLGILGEEDKEMKNHFEPLIGIMEFAVKTPNAAETVSSKEVNCLEKGSNTFNINDLLPLENDMRQIEDVALKMKNLDKQFNAISVFQANGLVIAINELKGILENTNISCAEKIIEISSLEYKFENTGRIRRNIFGSLRKVRDIAYSMKELKNTIGNINSLKEVKFDIVMDQLQMKTVSDCFRGPKFNGVNASLNVMNSILSISPAAAVISTSYKNKLKKVKNALAAIYKTASTSYSTRTSDETTKILLAFNNSKTLAENIGKSTGMLESLEAAYQDRKILLDLSPEVMPKEILRICENEGLSEWKNPRRLVNEMIADYERLNKVAKSLRNDGLIEMTKIFEEAAGIRGLPGSEGQKLRIGNKIVQDNMEASKTYKNQKHIIDNITKLLIKIEKLDLDFAKNQGRLKNAKVTVTSLMNYFDEIFGNSKQKTVTIEKQVNLSWIVILGLSIGIFFSILIGLIAIYGLTKSGRAKYRNTYMYYCGKPEDFEKRWRYSNFMDTINGKNALLDAVREENEPNLLKALKNGAYIDAYNKFGNTALHVATKLGHPEFVELLIKYGADRSLLNYKNLRPMQLIPYDKNDLPEHKAKCDQIKKIYKKYENKAFRCSVPQVFPSSSFHIYMDDSTDVKLCNSFIDKFPGITTDEITSNITHCVVKVDSNGVFETDRLDLLQRVFHGEIIVKEQWMADCLNDEKFIEQDYKYLVEEIKFNGVVYKSVLQWTEAMAKGTMPYLVGACVVFVFKAGYPNLAILTEIIKAHGGYVLSQFPQKEHFNVNSHPYLHSHLGPLFVLHDGSTDLTVYKNDADRMFTVFDEQEFVEFMLKRDIHRDNTEKPIAVMIGDE